MATVIPVDKKNGEAGPPVAPKNWLKQALGPFKFGIIQVSTSYVGKMLDASPALPKVPRSL